MMDSERCFAYMDTVSDHLVRRFLSRISPGQQEIFDSTAGSISAELVQDLDHAADVLAAAWRNPSQCINCSFYVLGQPVVVFMTWDVRDLQASLSKKAHGLNVTVEDQLLSIFSPFCSVQDVLDHRLPLLDSPAVVVDASGHILLWALPGLLTLQRQVRFHIIANCPVSDSRLQ